MITRSTRCPLVTVFACVTLLTGCAGNGSRDAKTPTLEGTTWHLTQAGGPEAMEPVPDNMTITLKITEDQAVSGSAGCNTYRSSCTLNGQSIRFAPIAMTKKMCPDPPDVMVWEQRFVTALAESTLYQLDGAMLQLQGREGATLQFRPASE